MVVMLKFVTPFDYELDYFYLIGNELDICQSMEEYFESSSTIDELIPELADNYTPIYYWEIYKNMVDMVEYINRAVNEYLVEVNNNNFDLSHIAQIGYFLYYTDILEANKEIIAKNVIINQINQVIESKKLENLDTDEILEKVEDISQKLDIVDFSLESLAEFGNDIIYDFLEE